MNETKSSSQRKTARFLLYENSSPMRGGFSFRHEETASVLLLIKEKSWLY